MPEHTTAYLDQAGRPKLRQSIVACFDIRGSSEASTSRAAAVDSQHVLDRIVAAIDDSRDFVRQSLSDNELANSGHWAIKFFNDNLAFGYPFERNVADPVTTTWSIVSCAQRFQFRMTLNGYFLRGVLTQGPICLTDEFIFGSALIEYDQFKSKASIVPRVVLTEPIRQLILTPGASNAEPSSREARDSLCRDVDGWWFLNYLDAARMGAEINWAIVERHKVSILKSLSSTTRSDVLPGFEWVCRYHNMFCHWHRDAPGYLDRYRIASADEQSTIVRPRDAES